MNEREYSIFDGICSDRVIPFASTTVRFWRSHSSRSSEAYASSVDSPTVRFSAINNVKPPQANKTFSRITKFPVPHTARMLQAPVPPTPDLSLCCPIPRCGGLTHPRVVECPRQRVHWSATALCVCVCFFSRVAQDAGVCSGTSQGHHASRYQFCFGILCSSGCCVHRS